MGAECKKGAAILKESDYANSVLLGMPLVQASAAEKCTPPFAVSIDESLRAFGRLGTNRITVSLWRWWSKNPENRKITNAWLPFLHSYYEWCRKSATASGYPPERIADSVRVAPRFASQSIRMFVVSSSIVVSLIDRSCNPGQPCLTVCWNRIGADRTDICTLLHVPERT
jgi:hypothetical protein